ncbi:uncharacterized protein [Nicotiana sylvestris]|uniref:uncharacterized protein n=1 Tax=Nicotiana sylvestris TaxID=4096 RepID=UPI00388C644A
MIQHPDKNFIDPIPVKIHDHPAYYAYIEEEANGNPWFHDIKEYLAKGEYPELANPIQKCTLRRLSNNFFYSGGILYRRTPDLGILKCVDAKEASNLLEEIHARTCVKLKSNGYPQQERSRSSSHSHIKPNHSRKPFTHLALDTASVFEKSSSVYSADGS